MYGKLIASLRMSFLLQSSKMLKTRIKQFLPNPTVWLIVLNLAPKSYPIDDSHDPTFCPITEPESLTLLVSH
jgi:hypothetical protein